MVWRRRLAVLAALLALVLPVATHAEVIYRERVEPFEISVRDGMPEDIWTAIRRYGPFIQGKHAVGSAAGRIKWSDLSIARNGHTCRLDAHVIDVEVVMTLPEWWRARHAPDDQLAYWQCIERTVTIHEKRHAEIWRETADAIDRAFRRLGDGMACDELRAAIGETGNRLFREGAQRQHVFDKEERGRRRYEQCVRPLSAEARPADTRLVMTPPRAPRNPSAMGLMADHRAATGKTPQTARLGGGDDEPRGETAEERVPSNALSGLAAAILALIAAIGGYYGVMCGVMAWSRRRPHEAE